MTDLTTTHWATLKQMVEAKGIKYVNKEQAIAALGGDAPEPAAPVEKAVVGKFNKNRPYGEIFGEVEGVPNARYFQDGHYFDGQGNKVG